MRWEARPSQGAIRSFLVLLASSSSNLQLTLGLFATKCEGAGMRISTKAEAMVLSWNGGMSTLGWWWAVASSGRVQVPLGLVHKWGNQGVRIWQIDWCGICSKVDAVMACCGKERVLSLKTKLSIYQSVRVLALICGHKWPVTKRLSIWVFEGVQRAYDTAFLGEVLWACPTGRRHWCTTRSHWRHYVSWLVQIHAQGDSISFSLCQFSSSIMFAVP